MIVPAEFFEYLQQEDGRQKRRQRAHREISYAKSVLRLAGYVWLLTSFPIAVALLIASELLGIAEEVWGA